MRTKNFSNNFYGVWGKFREEFLKSHSPKRYRFFKENPDIFSKYLDHFQAGYSIRAACLAKKLEIDRKLDEKTFKDNAPNYIIACSKIEEFVGLKMRSEICQ